MPGQTAYCPDFVTLMALESQEHDRFSSLTNDRNDNDRVYGGQLLAQVVAAAQRTVSEDRVATMVQLLYLAGAKPEDAIDYAVTRLQDGRRFSSRQITARQGNTTVTSAHVSFQIEGDQPCHEQPIDGGIGDPEASRPIIDFEEILTRRLGVAGYLSLQSHPYVECRFIDPLGDLLPEARGKQIRYWMRIGQKLPDAPQIHACAIAYLSDWWLNYTALAPLLKTVTYDDFYASSLNHTLWYHTPCRADEWMYCVADSPWANTSRGLSLARFYRRDGGLIASMAQEALQALRP